MLPHEQRGDNDLLSKFGTPWTTHSDVAADELLAIRIDVALVVDVGDLPGAPNSPLRVVRHVVSTCGVARQSRSM